MTLVESDEPNKPRDNSFLAIDWNMKVLASFPRSKEGGCGGGVKGFLQRLYDFDVAGFSLRSLVNRVGANEFVARIGEQIEWLMAIEELLKEVAAEQRSQAER